MASSTTFHCKTLKQESMSSIRLVSGVLEFCKSRGAVFNHMGAARPPYTEAIGGLEAKTPTLKIFYFLAKNNLILGLF